MASTASSNSGQQDMAKGRAASVKHDDADTLVAKFKDQIKGKTILITGASPSSLGSEFVKAVSAAQPSTFILAGPSVERLNGTIEAVKSVAPSVDYHAVELNLASQAAVRAAADEVNKLVSKIDVLVLNAGIMASTFGKTAEGIEMQFGTNHIGHFLFGNLLLPKVLAAGPGSRIVVVSSDGHRWSPPRLDDLSWSEGAEYNKWHAYGASKTANALFAFELARRLESKQIYAYALQPGFVPGSNLSRDMDDKDRELMGLVKNEKGEWVLPAGGSLMTKSLNEGVATYVTAAFDPEIVKDSGKYLRDLKVATSNVSDWCHDPELAKRLWAVSEDLVGEKFEF